MSPPVPGGRPGRGRPASVASSVDVALEPDAAFRVFTTEIDAWYLVDRNTVLDVTRTVEIRLEPCVGGRLLDVHDAATGDGRAMAVVTRWEPGRALGLKDPDGTEVEVVFEAVPYGTRVTLEHRGLDRLPPARAAQVRRFGWPIILGWYDRHVRHRPERPERPDLT